MKPTGIAHGIKTALKPCSKILLQNTAVSRTLMAATLAVARHLGVETAADGRGRLQLDAI